MNRKILALLLAAALSVSLLGASVLAADQTAADPSPQQSQSDSSGEPSQESARPDSSQEDSPASAGPEEPADGSSQPGQDVQVSDEAEPEPEPDFWQLLEQTQFTPDPVGSITFANLGVRLRENNHNLLALEETIATIEATDYDRLEQDIRDGLNGIADMQWMLVVTGNSFAASSLQSSYDSLRDTFEDLRDGKLQQDNADLVRQLRAAQNQIVMASEALYVALAEMEATMVTVDRGLATLDRSIQEMELRYQLGQISALTLQQVKAQRTSLVSQQQTLQMNIQTYKMQLEMMIGASLTGGISLGALPSVSDQRLAEMDLEADLTAYQQASYDLYAAQKTLEDAHQDFKDSIKGYGYHDYQYVQAQHTWQSAQHTYSATTQNYELKFRTLYQQVKDYQQVLKAAQTALACEQDSYAASQLKYEQGSLSKNKLLDAADQVSAAQDKVTSAAVDLFSAYHNYRWAVDYGILN